MHFFGIVGQVVKDYYVHFLTTELLEVAFQLTGELSDFGVPY